MQPMFQLDDITTSNSIYMHDTFVCMTSNICIDTG